MAEQRSLATATRGGKGGQETIRKTGDVLADLLESFLSASPGLGVPGFAGVGAAGRGPKVLKKVADIITETPEGATSPRAARFLQGLARRFSGRPADIADLSQEGAKAITEAGAARGGEVMSTAARPIALHAMRDYRLAGMTATARKKSLIELGRLEQTLKARYGDVSDQLLLYHWRKNHPAATLQQVRELRMGGVHHPTSLDQMFKAGFNPPDELSDVSKLREREDLARSAFAKLSKTNPAQAEAIRRYVEGTEEGAGLSPAQQMSLQRAVKSMQRLMGTEQVTLRGQKAAKRYKPVERPATPAEGPPPESVGAAAYRETPADYARTPEFRKEVNDYARFVMGKGPQETKAADPEIQRQLVSAWRQNMGNPRWEIDRPEAIPDALWERMASSAGAVERALHDAGHTVGIESGLKTPGMPLFAATAEEVARAGERPVANWLDVRHGTRPIFDIKVDEWLNRRR